MTLVVLVLLIIAVFLIVKRSGKPSVNRTQESRKAPVDPISRKSIFGRTLHNKGQIGNTEAVCPHCDHVLEKKPGRKKKCPHCGDFIYVRTRPIDRQRVLVTLEQAEEIEDQWSNQVSARSFPVGDANRIAKEKAKLKKRFGAEPSENDVSWSILNQDLIEHSCPSFLFIRVP